MDATEPLPRPKRTARDWVVDICAFILAVGFGVLIGLSSPDEPTAPPWLLTADQIAAAAACAALSLRRRWPVALALALVPLATFSELSSGAQAVALFTVAVHCSFKTTALMGALGLATMPVYMAIRPEPEIPSLVIVLFGTALTLAIIGWGLFIRHRRQLLLSLRERAVRAETEARLRAEQTQHQVREQIAREMHDVLGHRLSLLSVHAGALEYRPGAPAEEIAKTASVIRASAHQALQDLREVIGVLRAPVNELPQPVLTDVRELVAESGRAGMRVSLDMEVADGAPESIGRTVYRTVQEGLTNARKHAPGANVAVSVTGGPGSGVSVEVNNTNGFRPLPTPSSGQGLIGLAERIALASGRLEHGHTDSGGFRLAAWIPWPQ